MGEIRREVTQAYPNDEGRAIARVDPKTLLNLDVDTGDCIKITGENTTLARVWRCDRADWESNNVFIDRFLRHNAGAEIGERVTLESKAIESAERIMLMPYRDGNYEFGENAAEMLKQQLRRRPVQMGDVVPIGLSGGRDPIPMVVTGPHTMTGGTVSESTTIEIPDGYLTE